jgi:hypothetical protein
LADFTLRLRRRDTVRPCRSPEEKEFDIDTTGGESAFVLRFFHVNGGSLKCRVTDVRCMLSWLIAEPDELRALLLKLQAPGEVPERIDTENA